MSSTSVPSNPEPSGYSTYPIPELLKRWERSELSAEQIIGYLLQNLLHLTHRLAEVEKRLRQLEASLRTPGA